MNILGPYVFVHLYKYTCRINRKSSSCEHHCLTSKPRSLNHLALHCRRPKRIVFSSIMTLQDTWLFIAPSLLGKMMNQGDRGQPASLLALLPWTHWLFLAHLCLHKLWTWLFIYTHSAFCPFLLCGLPTWVPGTCEVLSTFKDTLGLELGSMVSASSSFYQRILKVLLWASCICFICCLLPVITDVPLLLGLLDLICIPSKGIKTRHPQSGALAQVYLGLKATEKK